MLKIRNDRIVKAQQEEIVEILRSFSDISKDNVTEVVRFKKGNYIVWLDGGNEFDWETTDHYDYNVDLARMNFNSYISRLNVLQHNPTARCLSKKQYKELNYMLAEVVVSILQGEIKQSEIQIAEIEEYLYKRNCEITRKWQLSYSFIILIFIAIVCIVGNYNSDILIKYLRIPTTAIRLISYSFLGAMGATLSIIQNSGKKNYDCESGRFLNFLEIVSKMCAGMIGSILVLFLYDSNIIFSNYHFSDSVTYIPNVLCIIAGFSERLVPSIISKFENEPIKE